MKGFIFQEQWVDVEPYRLFVTYGNYQNYFFTAYTVVPEHLTINIYENESSN